jgi:hypothetical protein
MADRGGFLGKLRGIVKGNAQHADTVIEKAEGLVDQRTGGKYAQHIDKGGDMLRQQLGLPAEGTIPVPAEPTPVPAPGEPGPPPGPGPGPQPVPEPVPDPGPVPSPVPGPESVRSAEADQQGSEGAGSGVRDTAPAPQPDDGIPAPNPMPSRQDAQPAAEPGAPLTPGERQPDDLRHAGADEPRGRAPAGRESGSDQPLPEGGPTQQGEPDRPDDPGEPARPGPGGPGR